MTTVRLEAVLEGHAASVRRLSFSPDGASIAAADDEGGVRVWDIANGTSRELPTDHRRSMSLALSQSAGFLAIAGPPAPSSLWDVARAQIVATLPRPGAGTVGLAARRDDEGFGIAMQQKVQLWEAPSGSVSTLALARVPNDGLYYIEALAFSLNGSALATGSTSTSWERGSDTPFESVRLWELPGGKLLRTFPATPPMHALTFSPGGGMLAAAGPYEGPQELHVWAVATGESLATLQVDGVRGWIRDIAFSSDERYLVIAMTQPRQQEANLLRLEPIGGHHHGGKLVLTLLSVLPHTARVALSPTGDRVATIDSSDEHVVRIWRISP